MRISDWSSDVCSSDLASWFSVSAMMQVALDNVRKALDEGRPALVWRRQIADTDTPISAALKLIEPDRGDFLLESVEGGAVRGRYSLLGLAPDLVFRGHGEIAEINRQWATDRSALDRKSTRLNSSH